MPAITSAVLGGVGAAVSLATAGASFGQAAKEKKMQKEANAASKTLTFVL